MPKIAFSPFKSPQFNVVTWLNLLCSVEQSRYFTIALHHSGDFNETSTEYVGGKLDYFDMCSVLDMTMSEINAMIGELGFSADDTQLYALIPENILPDGLYPLESDTDVDYLTTLVEYTHCQIVYATKRRINVAHDLMDFSFTQMYEDERVDRIEKMRDEVEPMENDSESENGDSQDEEENVGDEENECDYGDFNSNSDIENDYEDSEDSDYVCDEITDEVTEKEEKEKHTTSEPAVKRRRRIPPPNPPYRTRKRGRYSMLRVSFIAFIFYLCEIYVLFIGFM